MKLSRTVRLLVACLLGLAMPTVSTAAEAVTLNRFEKPFGYAYGSFNKNAEVADGVGRIKAPHGKGGAGFNEEMDLSAHGQLSPVLLVKLGEGNKAERIRLIVDDAGKNQVAFDYDLSPANAQSFTPLYPAGAAALSPKVMGEATNPFDPARVTGHHIQGDWRDTPVDVQVQAIELRPISAAQEAEREAQREEVARRLDRERQAAAKRAAEVEKLLAGASHPADGAKVFYVGTLASDLLVIHLRDRELVRGKQVPYEPEPGDVIEENKKQVLAWKDGKPAFVPGSRTVKRQVPRRDRPQEIGTLLADGKTLAVGNTVTGTALTMETLGEPRAYRVHSGSDSAYSQGVQPSAVYQKSKPLGPDSAFTGKHWVYLRLPQPLQPGQTYEIEFVGVNTRDERVSFTYDSKQTYSPAIHVSQVGYRPDDPFKRALLSAWLGTGGAHAFDAERFEVIDEAGKVVHTGKVERILAVDEIESLVGKKNHTGTNVYAMNFADFNTPGTYRVHVPGVGVSRQFEIGQGTWQNAFAHSMKGLLAHRSGIALPRDLIGYDRPRPMHPDDGFVVLQADVTVHDGEAKAILESMTRLLGPEMDASKLERVPNAWGGHMDAGDWDRRAKHLEPTYKLVELFTLRPEYFERKQLTLPAGEVNNRIPDLLDEALWNVAFFERLQREDGGVRGGIESTEHPRSGEASWQESLVAAAFMPDPQTNYTYAATAAKLSGALKKYDPSRADELATSARRAWDWAEANAEGWLAGRDDAQKRAGGIRDAKALAAVELYRLTEDKAFHAVFKDVTTMGKPGSKESQTDALFAYVTLPEAMVDKELAEQSRKWLLDKADAALRFAEGNAFGISLHVPNLPMMGWVGYYTTPESVIGPMLPRAHHLTGEEKYLAGAIRATQYGVGVNPMNLVMTTGLGEQSVQFPLHVDANNTGQVFPPGITVYGPHDPKRAPGWIKQWYLKNNLVPEYEAWPAAEFYIDLGNWPEMTEYTIHQTIAPTAYYWGYLAARS